MVIFISNFVSPHTIPFSEELYALLGEQFFFIETRAMSAERSSLGYDKLRQKPFVVDFEHFQMQKEQYMALIDNADVVLASLGSIDISLLEGRIVNNRQTFLMSERLFKKGWLKFADPKLWKTMRFIRRIQDKNFHLLCMGAYVAKDFARVGFPKDKMWKFGYITTPSAKDCDKLMYDKCSLPIKILWVGRMIWWKQPLDPIKAVSRLLEDGHDVLLNVVGGGKLEDKVKKLIANLNKNSRIQYSGLKDNSVVRNMMEESHVLLCTSNRLEGWGAVINEGMNAGCVVVANQSMGAAPYLIEDGVTGFTYDGGEDALYRKLKSVLTESNMKSVARNGYDTITKEWCPKTCAEKFLVFCKTIKEGNVPFEVGPFSKA